MLSSLLEKLRSCLKRRADEVIGGSDRPYLRRWWLIPKNRLLNVYLHQILRSDDDRALHDHPWPNCSIVLRGAYREVMPDLSAGPTPYARIADLPLITKVRRAGSLVLRRASAAHRLEILGEPVWTLFITGPRVRPWGFHCPHGWRHWKDFVATHDPGAVGQGCVP